MSRIIREFVLPCYEEAGLLWVHGVHGKVGESPEVVRCRECEHFKEGERSGVVVGGKTPNWCMRHTYDGGYPLISPDEDNFCSWGERRDA